MLTSEIDPDNLNCFCFSSEFELPGFYCMYLLLKKLEREKTKSIQLFRERLLEKAHATIPKGRYCGWFWVDYSSKEFERMAREATDVCLRVLKESNKSRFDSYSVRNSVLISSHITFRNYRMHIFSDDLSRNSCMPRKGI